MVSPRSSFLLVLLAGSACSWFQSSDGALFDPRAAEVLGIQQTEVDTRGYDGISDLAVDPNGHFWVVPERDPVILRIDFNREKPAVDAPPVRIEGVPDGADTESLAWLDANHVVFGTETRASRRDHDDVLVAVVDGDVARVERTIALPYALWNMRARANDGLEGVCAANGQLVASVETTLEEADARYAPIGRYDLHEAVWIPYRLKLTSRKGKLSALTCRSKDAHHLELMTIERHFGVSRLLHFIMPLEARGGDLVPSIMVELGRAIVELPNYEGLAWSAQNGVWLVADNQFLLAIGPTRAAYLPPQPVRTHRP